MHRPDGCPKHLPSSATAGGVPARFQPEICYVSKTLKVFQDVSWHISIQYQYLCLLFVWCVFYRPPMIVVHHQWSMTFSTVYLETFVTSLVHTPTRSDVSVVTAVRIEWSCFLILYNVYTCMSIYMYEYVHVYTVYTCILIRLHVIYKYCNIHCVMRKC